MSGNAPSQNPTTTKQTTDDSTNTPNALQQQKEQQEQQQEQQKRGPPLEEDDEFEDFPVDDWPDEQTEAGAAGAKGNDADANAHLWEESWDDDDAGEDFAVLLREELKKVDGGK